MTVADMSGGQTPSWPEQMRGRFRGPSIFGTSLYWQRRFLPKRRDCSISGETLPRAPYAG
jgi:hypothetical protein